MQCGLDRGLTQLGHAVEDYRSEGVYDLVLVFNQCAHTTRYIYPDFPADRNIRFAFVDCAEFGYFTRLPHRYRDYANTFTHAAMSHDTKNYGEQWRLRNWLEGKSFPYFLREYHKSIKYPDNYFPVDYPLYAYSTCTKRPSRHDYMSRQEDLFLSWGASHPWRLDLTRALREHPCKKTVLVLEENGTPRMIQSEYFERMEAAKCSVSYDGYGSGSFRMTEVLVRAPLLQGPLAIVTRSPLIDGETCIAFDVVADGENFLSTNISDKLSELLANPERSYQIFENAFEHCMSKLTEMATARYVLEVCEKHRWDVPTALEVT